MNTSYLFDNSAWIFCSACELICMPAMHEFHHKWLHFISFQKFRWSIYKKFLEFWFRLKWFFEQHFSILCTAMLRNILKCLFIDLNFDACYRILYELYFSAFCFSAIRILCLHLPLELHSSSASRCSLCQQFWPALSFPMQFFNFLVDCILKSGSCRTVSFATELEKMGRRKYTRNRTQRISGFNKIDLIYLLAFCL